MKTEPLFIANGKYFTSLEKVEQYAADNGWRISNVEKVKGPKGNFPNRRLITLEKLQEMKDSREIAEIIMQAGQFGGSLDACAALIELYARGDSIKPGIAKTK